MLKKNYWIFSQISFLFGRIVLQNTFFLENALKKTTEYFLKFLFLFESTILPVNNENNFIQMIASAVHTVSNTIGPIFKHIMDCVQLYFTNGFTNIVL